MKIIYKNVDYLSVRDKITNSTLTRNHINSILVPDSAILMSKHFTQEFLDNNISKDVNKIVSKYDKYCFFQVNKKIGLTNIDIIVQQLEDFYNKTNIAICLCPIGIALGHNDYDALSQIDSLLKVPHFSFSEEITIWDIMYLISNSKLYIGTSLHGAITAMSFKIPYIGLEVKKLNYYLQTWAVEDLNKIVEFNILSYSAIKAIEVKYEELDKNYRYQAHLVEESFKKMR